MTKNIWPYAKRKIQNRFLRHLDVQLVNVPRNHSEDLKRFFGRIHPLSTNHKLIRVGDPGDGGYLVPDDLGGIKTCFSPGVSNIAEFELDLIKRNIKCYLADYSVESPPIQNPLMVFEKKFLGPDESSVFTTLTNWVTRNAERDDNDMILQMDIEGAEYRVLVDTLPDVLKRFRIIVIEFHSLEQLFNGMGFTVISAVFAKLLTSFEIVHIHPNNGRHPINYKEFSIPPVMEFTFLRKDRISFSAPTERFPHELDRPNVTLGDIYPLPGCWFGKV